MTDQKSDIHGGIVLVLGSAPNVMRSRTWRRAPFDSIVSINNAWSVRPDWDILVYPEDFPKERRPTDVAAHQQIVEADAFVPAQNRFGGFVLAGGTMVFTTAYWALDVLRPKVMAFLGCDMIYGAGAQTHFYGNGTADPLRDDITLRDLKAKSARLALIAAAQGCACVNLSREPDTELVFPRATPGGLRGGAVACSFDANRYDALRAHEAALGYDTPDGRYWESQDRYDPKVLAALDRDWRALFDASGVDKRRFADSMANL